MRQVLLAGKEAQKRPPLLREVIADGAAQHWVGSLDGVQDRALRHRPVHVDAHLTLHPGQRAKMRRQQNPNRHDSVCASMESTAGRSRTIGVQLSPASRDAYT